MRSAEVMVSADPTAKVGSQLVSIASAGWTVAANGAIDIEVNPGTAGRGSAAEILRATFAAPR
jgi:hypothetical protein